MSTLMRFRFAEDGDIFANRVLAGLEPSIPKSVQDRWEGAKEDALRRVHAFDAQVRFLNTL